MEECICCKIAQGRGDGYQEKKYVIELEGGWVLNHYYGGENTYLGWLVLGTKCHRPDWDKLKPKELEFLGKNIQHINKSLRECWGEMFPKDTIELVHFAYLNETPHINRHIYLLNKKQLLEESHVHIHLLTRSQKMGEAVGYCADKIGWHLVDYVCRFPNKYKVSGKDDTKVIELMNKLKYLLGRRTTKNE